MLQGDFNTNDIISCLLMNLLDHCLNYSVFQHSKLNEITTVHPKSFRLLFNRFKPSHYIIFTSTSISKQKLGKNDRFNKQKGNIYKCNKKFPRQSLILFKVAFVF